jgi:ABC-2 type transport system permease protein
VTRFLALSRRELMAYFYAPVPYLVMFLFLLLTFALFTLEFSGDWVAVDYTRVFGFLQFILLFLIPLLTMNSVAEERSRNTLETLLTAPVADFQVVLSKWLGSFAFYVVMLVPTLVYWAVLTYVGRDIGKPDPGPVATAYLGALMLGGLYVSIGVFASSLTEDALLSAFVAFFVLIALMLLPWMSATTDAVPAWLRDAGQYVAPSGHFGDFLQGRVTLHSVIYFASFTAFFQFLAVRALESRKWR